MATGITQTVRASWIDWKRCRGVVCDRRMPMKLKEFFLQNCCQPSSVACCRNLGNNERTRSTTRSKRDEDAEVDERSDKEGYDPK